MDILACIVGIIAFFLIAALAGYIYYKERRKIKHHLRNALADLLALIMGIAASYFVMFACKLEGISGAFLQVCFAAGLFLSYRLFISESYHSCMFYGEDREDYGFTAYREWRAAIQQRYSLNDKEGSQDAGVAKCGSVAALLILCFFISLIVFYSEQPRISADYAVEYEPIKGATLEFVDGAAFYSGLPFTGTNKIWTTPTAITLTGVKVYLVEDKRDYRKHYWIIYYDDLTSYQRKQLPEFFGNYDFFVIDDYSCLIKRSDGQLIS